MFDLEENNLTQKICMNAKSCIHDLAFMYIFRAKLFSLCLCNCFVVKFIILSLQDYLITDDGLSVVRKLYR